MTVARRQQISVFDLSSIVENHQSEISVLRAQQVNENSLIRAENSLIRAEATTENGALREQ